MVETASRLYRESGGGSFEDLSEALSEDNELSDVWNFISDAFCACLLIICFVMLQDFFEMLRRGGAGSRGS